MSLGPIGPRKSLGSIIHLSSIDHRIRIDFRVHVVVGVYSTTFRILPIAIVVPEEINVFINNGIEA